MSKQWLCDGDMFVNEQGNLVSIKREEYWGCESPRTYNDWTQFYVWSRDWMSPDDCELWCGDKMGRRVPSMWEVLEDFIDYGAFYDDEYDEKTTEWMTDLENMGTINDYIPEMCDWLNEHGCYALPISVSGYYDVTYSADLRYDRNCTGYDGIIFMTEEGREKVGTPLHLVPSLFDDECKVFSDWCNSNIFGYVEFDKLGNEVDSCCGFIGDDSVGAIEYYTGELSDCDFSSVSEYVAAHKDDPDVLVARYNEARNELNDMTETLKKMLKNIVDVRKLDVRFVDERLVLEA